MEKIENRETPLFPISVAASLLEISVHTLRMYEKEGLIIPFKKKSNHRLYSKSDIDRLTCIRKAINEDKISINGIKTIFSLIPCWSIIHCSEQQRENCFSYHSHSEPCWVFNHNNNDCENINCRECEVYKDFSECKSLKEKLKLEIK